MAYSALDDIASGTSPLGLTRYEKIKDNFDYLHGDAGPVALLDALSVPPQATGASFQGIHAGISTHDAYMQGQIGGGGLAWLGHGAWVRGSDLAYIADATHASFGARGILFDFSTGIRFLVSGGAVTDGSPVTLAEPLRIGNDGYVKAPDSTGAFLRLFESAAAGRLDLASGFTAIYVNSGQTLYKGDGTTNMRVHRHPYVNERHIESGTALVTTGANSYGTTSVAFTDAFSTAPKVVVSQAFFGSAPNPIGPGGAYNKTTTGFTLIGQPGASWTNQPFDWIAEGVD